MFSSFATQPVFSHFKDCSSICRKLSYQMSTNPWSGRHDKRIAVTNVCLMFLTQRVKTYIAHAGGFFGGFVGWRWIWRTVRCTLVCRSQTISHLSCPLMISVIFLKTRAWLFASVVLVIISSSFFLLWICLCLIILTKSASSSGFASPSCHYHSCHWFSRSSSSSLNLCSLTILIIKSVIGCLFPGHGYYSCHRQACCCLFCWGCSYFPSSQSSDRGDRECWTGAVSLPEIFPSSPSSHDYDPWLKS